MQDVKSLTLGQSLLNRWIAPLLFLLLGTFLAFHPAILSQLTRMQTDPGDTRYNQYMLEHGFLWLKQVALHTSFWDAPFFYPAKNVSAHSDILIGAGWPYWIWRSLGLGIDSAYQAWMMSILALNFLAAYWLLGRVYPFSTLARCVGAFLFAYSAPRVTQIGHQQLLEAFYVLIALGAVFELFSKDVLHSSRFQEIKWIFLFFTCFVLQLYAGFYLGWFLVFFLFLLGVVTLFTEHRRQCFQVLKRTWGFWLMGISASLLALIPWIEHYSQVARASGGRSIHDIILPQLQSWIYLGEESWLYAWQTKIRVFQVIGYAHEQRLGVGLITTGFFVWGLKRFWHLPVIRLSVLTTCLAILLLTDFRYGIGIWQFLHAYIPGAQAVRAFPRIGVFLLFVPALGIAFAIQLLQKRDSRWWTTALCVAVILLEQARTTGSFSLIKTHRNINQIASQVGPHCKSFLFTPENHERVMAGFIPMLDAMFASLQLGIPTVNGYSGNFPSPWDFGQINRESDRTYHSELLKKWSAARGLDLKSNCWIVSKDYTDEVN